MKTLPFLLAPVLLASSLFAQQAAPTPNSELSKLRQGYVDSLTHLLQQSIKSSDVVAAVAVSQELDQMARTAPIPLPETSPCGSWRWQNDATITLAASGLTTNTAWKTNGVWHWIDEPTRQFQIQWLDGFVDQVTVSPDGTKLLITNNIGAKFMAERLPLPSKVVAGTTAD